MKKLLQWMFLLALIGAIGTVQAQSFNYTCNFEAESDTTGWVFQNGETNHWFIDTATNNTVDGTKSLYVSSDANGATHSYDNSSSCFIYAYREVTLEVGTYDMKFDWIAQGESGYSEYDYMRAALVPSTSAIPASAPYDFDDELPYGWIALDGGSVLNSSSTWSTHMSEVDVTTAGTYKLAFFWRNDFSGGSNPPAAIDNIVFKAQTCPKPSALLASDMTVDGASLSWTEVGTATEWQIEYGPMGFQKGTGTVETVYENPYSLVGLNANTAYDVYLSSVCAADDTSSYIMTTFRTNCGEVVLPLVENFESGVDGDVPFCWFNKSGNTNVYEGSYNSNNSMHALKLYGGGIIMSPRIDLAANELGVYFAAMKNSTTAGDIEIGFVTDTTIWDYVPVQTISVLDDYYHYYEVDLDVLSDITDGGHIVFTQKDYDASYASWYIDDVNIFQLGNCRAPMNFVFSEISDVAATLSWTCATSDASFKVRYGGTTIDVPSATTVTLTGLTPNTVYKPMIRTNCGETDSSYWFEMGWFRTATTCADILEARVANVTSTGAAISWVYSNAGQNPATGAKLEWKATSETDWNVVNVTGNGYFLTGLTPGGNYDIRISSICDQDTSEMLTTMFTTPSGLCGEVVGDGVTTVNNLPINDYFNYSYSQTIYPKEAVAGMDTIRGIVLHTAELGTTVGLKVHMGNTNKNSYASASDYVAYSDMTVAFRGSYSFSGNGWDTITFSTPFVNDGRNVVVCIEDTAYGYSGSWSGRVSFYSHDGNTLYKYADYGTIDPSTTDLDISYSAPDIRFVGVCEPLTCVAPLLNFVASDVSSITVSWIAGLDETEWSVDYRVVGDTAWESFATNVTDTFAVITGLNASTIYEVRVGSICTDDTKYAMVQGATGCGDLAIPYYDSFEAGSLNMCWSYGSTSATGYNTPSIVSDYLYMPANSYAILPTVSEDISTLQLVFHLNDNGTNAPLFVGVCSDRNSISTFTCVDTIYVDAFNSASSVISRLSSYTGDGQYIALKTGAKLMDIYDMKIELIPSCPAPIHAHATAIGGTYVNATWESDATATAWTATIVPSGNDVSTGDAIACSDASVSFTGLNVNTTYDVYIASVCGSASSEATMFSVTTLGTDPLALPYSTNFADYNENLKWSYYNAAGSNKWAIGASASNGNANALYVSDDNGATNNYNTGSASVSMAYIPILVSEAGMHAISYDWKCAGESRWDFARVALVSAAYDYADAPTTKGGYEYELPTGWIALDNGLMSESNTWTTATKKASVEAGSYFLTFVWGNDGGGGTQPPMAIDNVTFGPITCSEPTGVTVTGITSTSATISWNSDENATNGWEVTLGNNAPVVVTDTFYTFDELVFGTDYTVNIRTLCSDESFSIPYTTTFTTLCAEIETMPYIVNFDSYSYGEQPKCWTPASTSYPKVDDGSLYFYASEWGSSTNVISMPKVAETFTMNTLELTFRAKGTYYGTSAVQVGVCTEACNDATFTPIQTIQMTSNWQDVIVSLANYTDTGRYITFKIDRGTSYSSTAYVDDVTLMVTSPCARPTQAAVNSYTHNSITIAWVDTNVDASFKVAIANVNDLNTATITEDVNATTYTFTDLAGSTNYHMWVAANCTGLDAVSGWVYIGSCTTHPTCGEITDLKVYDITETSATVSWRAPMTGEPVTDYIVSTQMNGNAPVVDTIQVPYMFMDNLQVDSSYTIAVTTLCDTTISFSNTCTFVAAPAPGCNTVGTGTGTTSNAPTVTNWNYDLSQMIYPASEMLGMGDTINGISFTRSISSWSTAYTDTRQVVVYMGMTNLSDCTGGWVDTNSLTVVYRGAWNLVVGACDIDFTTPFIYSDHSKNLVVMIDDNTGSYNGSSSWASTTTESVQTLYARADYSDITTASAYSTSLERPNIVFDATCSPITCFPPSIVVTNLADTTVSLVWNEGNDETAWKVEYCMSSEDAWTIVSANTSVKSATINGLLPGTEYSIRVGSICGSNVAYRTITIMTDCGPMPTPFIENFNDEPLGEFEKNCWTVHSDSWNEPEVANIVGNGYMLLMEDNPYVVLPEVRGELNSLQIRMRYLTPIDSIATVVGYVSNPADFTTFIAVDTIYDINSPSGSYSTVLFNTVADGVSGHIAFCSNQDRAQVVYDDIIVEPIRSCVEPSDIVVSNITTTSADVAWNGNATNYEVVYGATGFYLRGEAGTTITATGSTTTINGLTSGTSYDIMVRAICGAGDTSYASNAVGFTTECAPMTTLPYVMNFELAYLPPLVETGRVPNCWTVAYIDDTNAMEDDFPQVVSERIGDHFVINGDYALRMDATGIVALPELGVDMDTMCLRFFHKTSSMSSRVIVGVLDNVGVGCEATFQAVDTIVPINTNAVNQYSVYFNHYTGTGKYIALRTMDMDPSVMTSRQYFDSVVIDYIPSCPEIINLEATATTSSTITIDWDDILAPASSYEVVYGAVGFNLDETGTSVIASAHPYVITGLDGLTNYEIWVRPICGEGDTGLFCMNPILAQTSVCDSPFISTTAPNGATGQNKDYPFDAFREYSYSQTIIDAAYLTGQTDITAVSFNTALESDGKFNNCRIYLGHTAKTSFASASDWVAVADMTLVYTGNMNFDAGLATIMFDSVFTYDGTSNLVIAIDRDADAWHSNHYVDVVNDTVAKTLMHSDDYDNQDPANPMYDGELFNGHAAFLFTSCGNSCSAPVLSAVTDLTYESATINWAGAGTNYEVAIRAEEETEMSAPIAVDAYTYTFTNLTPNVNYTYYVRQICEEGVVSDWAEGFFTTEDLPCFTPSNLAVVSNTAETVTLSWTAAEGQTKWSIHVFNTLEDHLDTVMANPGTVTGLTGGQTYNVAVNAICATNYASEWSDTIEFTTTDCLPVSGVSISDITANSAKVSWTAGGSESAWQINYGEAGFGQGEGEFVDVTTNSYVMTNLEEETEYDVYVRAMCSADFTSSWSDIVTFQTLAGGTPEGIDGVDGQFNFVIYPNPTSGATTISLNGVEGEVTISVVDMNGRTVVSEGMECGSDCEKRLDVTGLAQGTYFVRVLGDNINSVRKLIVR